MSNPAITLYDRQTVIAKNDDWQTPTAYSANYVPASGAEIDAARAVTGAFVLSSGSTDSALLVTLAPGVYTATVSGVAGATGAAMVEIYEVP